MDHHLLIETREFEDQETLLTAPDFEAMWLCMGEFDGLAFYNSGEVAGASQAHKHLQLVPLPLGGGRERTPIEGLLTEASFQESLSHASLGTVPGFHFAHSLARVDHLNSTAPSEAARATEAIYLQMLEGWVDSHSPHPYNLLVTRDWMLFVPRSEEMHGSISVNALGFAGSLLARDEGELEAIRKRGPMGILEDVGA